MPDSREPFSGLHAEWLKLKGCLFDPTTQLPALPAVVDDVRRRLEAGERLGLIYLDLSSGGPLEATTGWQLYDLLVGDVARALHACRSGLLVERDTLAQVGVRSDEFLLFVGLGGDGASPAWQLDHLHREVAMAVERALQGRPSEDGQQLPPLQSAAIEVAVEPTVRIERAIYRSLEQVRTICRHETEKRHTGQLADLLRILGERQLLTRFQPIVELGSGGVHGFEALSSPSPGSTFTSPELLFGFAEETGRIVELDRLCRTLALTRAAELRGRGLLPAGGKVFLNCSAPAFGDPRMVSDLLGATAAVSLEPRDVVLEVTERVAITEWRAFRKALDTLRGAGFAVAIDDMGSGYSSLQAVAEIEPDYLKFDLSLVLDIHRSRIKRDLLEGLVHLAQKIGAHTVAEGIEGCEELEVVRALRIAYGQGYLFARPAPAAELGGVYFPTRPELAES